MHPRYRGHAMLSENLVSNPGEHRTSNTVVTVPKWYDIPREMRELVNFINSRDYRPVERAAYTHYRVVQNQPFPNFNNAVARLIMKTCCKQYY
jgi:Fic family protein